VDNRAPRRRHPMPEGGTILTVLEQLVPAGATAPGATAPFAGAAAGDAPGASVDAATGLTDSPLALTPAYMGPFDASLHRAFFRRVVEAEFTEHPAGLAWPDVSTVQGSLATRLRLFERQPATAPRRTAEISDGERDAGPPWKHLHAVDALEYRRGDTLARLSHRAFAPLAFLELHARLDLESGEREELEAELLRALSVGYGKILTPPCVLSAANVLRERLGCMDALLLVDEARLAMRSVSGMADAERVRADWLARARASREQKAWPGELMSMVECLLDYWFVQRAAAADIDWAEAMARLENSTIGAALAKRDAEGEFQFAAAVRYVCGGPRVTELSPVLPAAPANAQPLTPTAAATVA